MVNILIIIFFLIYRNNPIFPSVKKKIRYNLSERGDNMELSLEQRKAKTMYAKGLTPNEIAKTLKIGKSTIYRWMKDDRLGFKESKKMAYFNSADMAGIVDESHKKLLIEISENPDKLLNPKTADALLKVSKVLESLGAREEKEKQEKKETEVKGVLIIDDIRFRALEKKADKIIQDNERELSQSMEELEK